MHFDMQRILSNKHVFGEGVHSAVVFELLATMVSLGRFRENFEYYDRIDYVARDQYVLARRTSHREHFSFGDRMNDYIDTDNRQKRKEKT
jgi:hypothetical protein